MPRGVPSDGLATDDESADSVGAGRIMNGDDGGGCDCDVVSDGGDRFGATTCVLGIGSVAPHESDSGGGRGDGGGRTWYWPAWLQWLCPHAILLLRARSTWTFLTGPSGG